MSKQAAFVDLNISDDLPTLEIPRIANHDFELCFNDNIQIVEPISDKAFGQAIVNCLNPDERYKEESLNIVTRRNSIKHRKCTPAPKTFGKSFRKRYRSSSPINFNETITSECTSKIQPSGDSLSTLAKAVATNMEQRFKNISLNKTPVKGSEKKMRQENDAFSSIAGYSTIDSDSAELFFPMETFRTSENFFEDISLISSQEIIEYDSDHSGECEQTPEMEDLSGDNLSDSHSFLNRCQTISMTSENDEE